MDAEINSKDNSTDMDQSQAKPSVQRYHRNLPHLQRGMAPVFVTFATQNRWILPESARSIILQVVLRDHLRRVELLCAIIMPDHAHLLFHPLIDAKGFVYPLRQIMQGIKGTSAREVNQLLGRSGKLWQAKNFDHLLRKTEGPGEMVEYIRLNPVRKGLVQDWRDWSWTWLNPKFLPCSSGSGA